MVVVPVGAYLVENLGVATEAVSDILQVVAAESLAVA